MKILIGADLVPTKSNEELFISSNVEALIGAELKSVLDSADLRIFNLETPLTNTEAPIKKCGPNLIAPTETINGYKALGVNLLTLANNHILDQGQQGLTSTCNLLKNNGINFLGIGKTQSEASKPYIVEFAGKKVGIYACAEHEFSIVSDNSPGANPFDPLETPDHIVNLKSKCDYVIVLYHGGKEHYRYPSPNLQKICRKLIDKGADLIICQHSHCIGCEEKYKDGTIVYGQGNFLFDHSESEYWQTSLLVELDDRFEITYIPIKKSKESTRIATDKESNVILNEFLKRSEEIKSSDFVEKNYKQFADTMIGTYLFNISGIKRTLFFRIFNKLSAYKLSAWIISKKYNEEKKMAVRNFIVCEAHRELLLKGLL